MGFVPLPSMQHFNSFDEVKRSAHSAAPIQNAWVTIGVFDGVHRGHQAILKTMAGAAHGAGSPAGVITFYPYPIEVLRGASEPFYLTTPDERARLLDEQGVDFVLTLTFDRALASLGAAEFMQETNAALGVRQLWAGDDFALGHNRQGDITALRQIGEQLGYSVHVIDKVTGNGPGERISSSRIRELLRAGEPDAAAQLLGRPYAVEGKVIHGDGRGRGLGFPTLNIGYPARKRIPRFGVYATWTWVDGRRLPSVTNVGVSPTFNSQPTPPRVEAFLLDREEDLYGRVVKVEFVNYLRPELRFDSVQALIDQMTQDTHIAREVLDHAA